ADFDNDGDQDLMQLVGAMAGKGCGPNQLYVNADGRLIDHAVAWSIDYEYSRGRAPTWLDYDNDGRLDLYHAAYARSDGRSPPTLFRNTPEGFVTFVSRLAFSH
ncbi:MAG: VCBS repeat-containing protein, partial [Rhodospirillales bacterium]|nr:VCBS repeat-containing protein [Rhodospirillales bacterium]